jgi:membrane protein implicated in regulation of membrane protease activity
MNQRIEFRTFSLPQTWLGRVLGALAALTLLALAFFFFVFFVIAASVGVLVFAVRRLLRPKMPAGPATAEVLEGEYTVETPEPPARIRHDD